MSKSVHTAWTRVHESLRPALQDGTKIMSDLLGSTLKGLTFHGEILNSGFRTGRESLHGVLVVSTVDLASLRRLAEYGLRLGKHGIAAPIVVTPEYIRDSIDTFPLEWLEIQQQGVTVFGDDCFSALSFDAAHIRLQCERELKRILMTLRQGLLASTGKQRAVYVLEREAMETLIRTLRGVLWIRGRREHLPTAVVLEEIENMLGAKLSGLRGTMTEASPHDWNEFDRLYADVEMLMGKADAL